MNKLHHYPALLPQLRDEAALTYAQIASRVDVTVGAVMKWKTKGITIEGIVKLLELSTALKLRCSQKFAHALQDQCGKGVAVVVKFKP